MKRVIAMTLVALVGALGIVNLVAADKGEKAPAEKRAATPPFNGKIAAVDAAAKTIKVGERTFHLTDATKVQKAGKPATLADAKVGDQVGGQYRTGEGGKLEVLSLRIGPKPDDKK